MTERINTNSPIQMDVIRDRIEQLARDGATAAGAPRTTPAGAEAGDE